MSQRLAIGNSPDFPNAYDCIITAQSSDNINKLKLEWLSISDGWYLGPWKISIFDVALFNSLESTLIKLFKSLDKKFPNDVWVIYYKTNHIEHPTKTDLHNFLNSSTKDRV